MHRTRLSGRSTTPKEEEAHLLEEEEQAGAKRAKAKRAEIERLAAEAATQAKLERQEREVPRMR